MLVIGTRDPPEEDLSGDLGEVLLVEGLRFIGSLWLGIFRRSSAPWFL